MIYSRFKCLTQKGEIFALGVGKTKEAAWEAAKERLMSQGYYIKSHTEVDSVDIDPDVHI